MTSKFFVQGTYERTLYRLLSGPYTPTRGVYINRGRCHYFHRSSHLSPVGRRLHKLHNLRWSARNGIKFSLLP